MAVSVRDELVSLLVAQNISWVCIYSVVALPALGPDFGF